MPMTKEDHELFLNELNSPELEHTRRTEILQNLRTDYSTVHLDFDELTTSRERLQKDNSDLVVSNSQLFRQLGTLDNNGQKSEEVEQKEFSETITLEDLEKTI